MDLQSTLQEYQIQLEQVEISLKNDATNAELLKLKEDLEEVVKLTNELIGETENETDLNRVQQDDLPATNLMSTCKQIRWKVGDKCLALWRKDSQYYPAVIDQVLEDGSCTIIFDGYANTELTQVSLLLPRQKNSNNLLNNNSDPNMNAKKINNNSNNSNRKPLTKKELELKLREAKKRKREKRTARLKELEDLSEKDKNKWKSFNTKLASKTWKGVVKKSKFELPSHHENKIGVGATRLSTKSIVSTTIVKK